ncbi:unnamed protein product [Urochloa humidicola]
MVSYSKGNITESPKLEALILNQLALAAILCTYYNSNPPESIGQKGTKILVFTANWTIRMEKQVLIVET